jgi:hypothetical protein
MTTNLNELSDFEINELVIKSYCCGQQITYEKQRMTCDIMEMPNDTCYFITASGYHKEFNYATHEQVGSFISEYKLNITHNSDDSVSISSTKHPDIGFITLYNSNYRKAVCFMVIKIFDIYKKEYVIEDIKEIQKS